MRFRERDPRARPDEETLVWGEDVTEEGEVAHIESVGRGPYRATAEELAVELHHRGRKVVANRAAADRSRLCVQSRTVARGFHGDRSSPTVP